MNSRPSHIAQGYKAIKIKKKTQQCCCIFDVALPIRHAPQGDSHGLIADISKASVLSNSWGRRGGAIVYSRKQNKIKNKSAVFILDFSVA